MREKEFKAVFDGDKYVMPQDMKYRVKSKISEKTGKTRKPFVKRSVSAMVSIVLASILVITAAAVGGIALFKSIYGENIDLIMPYSEEINLTASDENYELTLHEAVADEYTTAYIFSIKRLTLGASEAMETDTSILFTGFTQRDYDMDYLLKYNNPQENPDVFIGYNGYNRLQTQIYYANIDIRVLLIRADAAYDSENGARYLMRAIEDLKTEDTDYYALYIVNGEDQMLSIGIGPYRNPYNGPYGIPCSVSYSGPELTLPKVTQKAPSVTRSVQEYYRQYLKQNEPAIVFGSRRLADTVTITPLAIYVGSDDGIKNIWGTTSIRYIEGAFYRTAELVFNDDTEKSLSDMSQNGNGIMVSNSMGVYLFDEVLDTSLVKSFMVYDTVEFPMDPNLPVIDRETGEEIVPQYGTIDMMYDVGSEIVDYLDRMYPGERTKNSYCTGPWYVTDNTCKINGHDCEIIMEVYDTVEGETLADAADRLLEEYLIKLNRTILNTTIKDGTDALGDIRYADVTISIYNGNEYHFNFFFMEIEGKLIVLQLTQKSEGLPYSLDALLQLITFE